MNPVLNALLKRGLMQVPRIGLERLRRELASGSRVLLNGNVFARNGYG